MERQRSDPTFGHDNDAPPGHWNVPQLLTMLLVQPQAHGATPNEFGFEPYEDEPPQFLLVKLLSKFGVMPTFNVQAPQMHGSMNNKAPPIVDAFNSDDMTILFSKFNNCKVALLV